MWQLIPSLGLTFATLGIAIRSVWGLVNSLNEKNLASQFTDIAEYAVSTFVAVFVVLYGLRWTGKVIKGEYTGFNWNITFEETPTPGSDEDDPFHSLLDDEV